MMLLIPVLLLSCKQQQVKEYYRASGPIQGTSYNVTYHWHEDISKQIDSVLHVFNKSLSNFDKNSTISRINRNEISEADDLFLEMFIVAREVYDKTDGAFDITIAPIANFWGFGWTSYDRADTLIQNDIDSLLQFVGMNKVRLSGNEVIKSLPEIQFIGSAIAKGQSVDFLARYLQEKGIENFLIEIGGEIRCLGMNPNNEKWRIGIDKPVEGSGYHDRENQKILSLTDKSLATSGNYRNYIKYDGKTLGHSLDPRTGYPAVNNLLSVTVITDLCIYADAWATAFMVLGLEKSLEIIEAHDNIKTYFIYLDEDGEVKDLMI